MQGDAESFTDTEVGNAVSGGVGIAGAAWRRPQDKMAIGLFSDGLSRTHRESLALGGLGFLLGDGRLNCGREQGFEIQYSLHRWRAFWVSPDLQGMQDRGYNRDRGPILLPGVRFHIDLPGGPA